MKKEETSFDKSFAISMKETYEKMEKADMKNDTTKVDTSNVIPDLQRSERGLLDMLRGENRIMPKHLKERDVNRTMKYDYLLLVSNGNALIGNWWGYKDVDSMLSAWLQEKLNDKKPILLLADGQVVNEVQTFKDLFEWYGDE